MRRKQILMSWCPTSMSQEGTRPGPSYRDFPVLMVSQREPQDGTCQKGRLRYSDLRLRSLLLSQSQRTSRPRAIWCCIWRGGGGDVDRRYGKAPSAVLRPQIRQFFQFPCIDRSRGYYGMTPHKPGRKTRGTVPTINLVAGTQPA